MESATDLRAPHARRADLAMSVLARHRLPAARAARFAKDLGEDDASGVGHVGGSGSSESGGDDEGEDEARRKRRSFAAEVRPRSLQRFVISSSESGGSLECSLSASASGRSNVLGDDSGSGEGSVSASANAKCTVAEDGDACSELPARVKRTHGGRVEDIVQSNADEGEIAENREGVVVGEEREAAPRGDGRKVGKDVCVPCNARGECERDEIEMPNKNSGRGSTDATTSESNALPRSTTFAAEALANDSASPSAFSLHSVLPVPQSSDEQKHRELAHPVQSSEVSLPTSSPRSTPLTRGAPETTTPLFSPPMRISMIDIESDDDEEVRPPRTPRTPRIPRTPTSSSFSRSPSMLRRAAGLTRSLLRSGRRRSHASTPSRMDSPSQAQSHSHSQSQSQSHPHPQSQPQLQTYSSPSSPSGSVHAPVEARGPYGWGAPGAAPMSPVPFARASGSHAIPQPPRSLGQPRRGRSSTADSRFSLRGAETSVADESLLRRADTSPVNRETRVDSMDDARAVRKRSLAGFTRMTLRGESFPTSSPLPTSSSPVVYPQPPPPVAKCAVLGFQPDPIRNSVPDPTRQFCSTDIDWYARGETGFLDISPCVDTDPPVMQLNGPVESPTDHALTREPRAHRENSLRATAMPSQVRSSAGSVSWTSQVEKAMHRMSTERRDTRQTDTTAKEPRRRRSLFSKWSAAVRKKTGNVEPRILSIPPGRQSNVETSMFGSSISEESVASGHGATCRTATSTREPRAVRA